MKHSEVFQYSLDSLQYVNLPMHWEQSEFISDTHCVMEHFRKLSYLLRSKEHTHDQSLTMTHTKCGYFKIWI